MEQSMSRVDHRKTKRRRRVHRLPAHGWLHISDQIKGNLGVISREFFAKLFDQDNAKQASSKEGPVARKWYIGITPFTSSIPRQTSIEDVPWVVVPVRAQTEEEQECRPIKLASVQLPSSSLATQTFVGLLRDGLHRKEFSGLSGVEIQVLDVELLDLDAVYVKVDGDALNKNEDVQRRFGGGFHGSRSNSHYGKSKEQSNGLLNGHMNGANEGSEHGSQDDKLTTAIREALRSSAVVRQGDLIELPLPAHPITHVPLPPAKITLCEPLSQGLLCQLTKIVVHRVHHHDAAANIAPRPSMNKAFHFRSARDEHDTPKEVFYSAAEDGYSDPSAKPRIVEERSSSDESAKESDSSSDDSVEEMISMKLPSFSMLSSSKGSSKTAGTPRGFYPRANGTSTPGSIVSNFTATTARQGAGRGSKIFQVQSLTCKIPDDLLCPKPVADDDDEARVFIDIKLLVRLGCFSGDWIKVEAARTATAGNIALWGMDALGQSEIEQDFRPAKVYGLPDLHVSTTSRYPKTSSHSRRSSLETQPNLNGRYPTAWLSPILIANLGQATNIRLSPLQTKQPLNSLTGPASEKAKVKSFTSPPVAQELTLLRISTPLSTERAMQTGLFSALKHHFETRKRILRQGDIIPFVVDVNTSRMLSHPISSGEHDPSVDELLSNISNDEHSFNSSSLDVAWFKVGQIKGIELYEEHGITQEAWGGATSIEPRTTRMRQAGNELCKITSAHDSPWEYYLGVMPPIRSTLTQSRIAQCINPPPTPYISPVRRRLRELIAAATSPRAINLGMSPTAILLHSTQRNIGKATTASRAASDLGVHLFEIDAYDILAEGAGGGDVKTEGYLKARVERALSCGAAYTVLVIRHVEVLTADRMVTALKEVVRDVRVIITTTNELDKVPDGVRGLFTHEIELLAPNEGERAGILQSIIDDRGIRLARDVDLGAIAIRTAALVAGNLVDVVDRAAVARERRLETLSAIKSESAESGEITSRDILVSGGEYARCLLKADFDVAVEAARKNFADAIGAPRIPNVSWDDVGGLGNVKDAVMETIQLPLERPELFAKGMKKRSGILFYGPPGTGKTLLAKAIATEFSLNFFSIKGPELLNMYIGESEANVRRVFQRARDARPCVVFFDELDSVAPKRGNQGDSGGVMDRIVSQLLAELDGMSDGEEGGGGVFVIGATNRPDLLDQALLRPGRFDKMLYLGVSDSHDKQLTILEALTRKFTLHPEMSLRRVADSLPFTYTGADLYALCSDAMLKAITRQASAVDAKIKALPNGPVTTAYFFDHIADSDDVAVMVTENDFLAAQRELVGSVSAKELEHYQRVRQTFEGPSKSKVPGESHTSAPSRIPAPVTDRHVRSTSATESMTPQYQNSQLRSPGSSESKGQSKGKGKGKGKATRWDSDDDDDEAYVTSNDFATPERRQSRTNATFGIVGQGDDEELYK